MAWNVVPRVDPLCTSGVGSVPKEVLLEIMDSKLVYVQSNY